MIPIETFLTPRQASGILGMKVQTVRHWLRTGRLPAVKMGFGWKIPQSKLRAYLDALPTFGPDVTPENGTVDESTAPPDANATPEGICHDR